MQMERRFEPRTDAFLERGIFRELTETKKKKGGIGGKNQNRTATGTKNGSISRWHEKRLHLRVLLELYYFHQIRFHFLF
jgi:hypothetical protein